MIDLNEINRDPWPTFPVNKDDLRSLLAENARMKDGLDDLCDFILRARCVNVDKDPAVLRKVQEAAALAQAFPPVEVAVAAPPPSEPVVDFFS